MWQLPALYGLVALGVFLHLHGRPMRPEDDRVGFLLGDIIVAVAWPTWVAVQVWHLATGR